MAVFCHENWRNTRLCHPTPLTSKLQVQACSGFRGCSKTEERMHKEILRLQPRISFLVRKLQMETCSHAVDLESFET